MAKESTVAAVADFSQAVGLLVRRVRGASHSEDLSWPESAVLSHLARRGATTTADLARTQGMRPQSMRTIVAGLERAGMVKRKPHATDGRQVNLELTAKGMATQKSSGDAKRTWLARAIGTLSGEEREVLFTAGRIMKRLAEGDGQ